MTGKQTCAILKEIRRDIAKKNDISIRIEECTHKGECRGTCPRCEAEVRILERELEQRKKRGLQTAIAGVSAGILAATLASCVPVEGGGPRTEGGPAGIEELGGMPVVPDPGEEDGETERAEALEGDIIAPDCLETEIAGLIANPNIPDGDEFPLMGEPPIEEYEAETEELPLAGKPMPADLEAEEPKTPEDEEEWPELAGIPMMPDDLTAPEQNDD